MEDISNSVDDIFADEAKKFESDMLAHRNMMMVRADVDGDGKADEGEGVNIRSGRVIRV